jgi:hypothetical protein
MKGGHAIGRIRRGAPLASQDKNRVRARVDFLRQFKLIWVSSPDAKISYFRKPETV